eukprot:g18289.t1
MSRFGKIVDTLCGDYIDKQAELKAKVRYLEKKIKDGDEVAGRVSSSSATEELVERFEKMTKSQKEEYQKQLEEQKQQLQDLKAECEKNVVAAQEQATTAKEQADLANEELEKSNIIIDEIRRDRSMSEVEQDGLGKEHQQLKKQLNDHSTALDELKAIMDEDNGDDHDCFEHKRAHTMPWDNLYSVTPLSDEEWEKEKEKYKRIQAAFSSPPTRKGKTFRNWQGALYRWAVRCLRTRWELEEIGHQVTECCFEGFPSAAQIADDNGPDLVKVMKEMALEESPMVEWIEQEMQRLLPMVKRKKGVSPMMWLTALKDVFNKEKQALGELCRNDQSRYNYIMGSLRLEPWAKTAIRQTHNPKASNNMLNIRTQLRRLNITSTEAYDDNGHLLKNTHFEKNYIEELWGLFGSSLKASDQSHTGEYNEFLHNTTGKSLYSDVCPEVSSSATGGGEGIHFGSDPLKNHDGLSFNAGGQKLTPEQLQQLRETPCQFGDKCRNLLTKGRCLRKHTGKEIATCKKEFETKFPEEAKKLKEERAARTKEWEEKKKKEAAAKKKKDEEAKAAGANKS